MKVSISPSGSVSLRTLEAGDIEKLVSFLQGLGPVTKKRFAPHSFDLLPVKDIFNDPSHRGYIAMDHTGVVIAYGLIRHGTLPHDRDRLISCGLTLSEDTDCTFAPAVADHMQGRGIGTHLLNFIIDDLRPWGIKRLILWGGVRTDNQPALAFYRKHGFRILGTFCHEGENADMVLDLL